MRAPRLVLLVYGALLLGLNVWPHDPAGVEDISLCLFCEQRGLADALVAALLFVPLGLALSRRRWLHVLGIGVGVAGLIELIQLGLPWRTAAPWHVLFSTLGLAAGLGLGRTAPYWVRPSTYVGDRLGTVMAILVPLSMLLTSWLHRPELPEPPYRTEWAAARPDLVTYEGTVLAAKLEPLMLTPGPGSEGETAQELLDRGTPFGVLIQAGPPPDGLAQLLGLYDSLGRTVAFLGIDSTDLVYRERTRASRWGLDNPDTRAPGALDSIAAGDTARVASFRWQGRRCFIVDDAVSCGYGLGGAHAWRFLYAFNDAPPGVLTLLDAAWLAILLFPVGYWARWHLALGLAATVGAYGWFRAPAETVLVPVPPIELTGILIGVLLGLMVRRLSRRNTT